MTIKIKERITQGQLEMYELELQKTGAITDKPLSVAYGLVVRAAVASGWVEGVEDPNEVSNLDPMEVRETANAIAGFYNKLTEIPKG